jgi:hypothetical protein
MSQSDVQGNPGAEDLLSPPDRSYHLGILHTPGVAATGIDPSAVKNSQEPPVDADAPPIFKVYVTNGPMQNGTGSAMVLDSSQTGLYQSVIAADPSHGFEVGTLLPRLHQGHRARYAGRLRAVVHRDLMGGGMTMAFRVAKVAIEVLRTLTAGAGYTQSASKALEFSYAESRV